MRNIKTIATKLQSKQPDKCPIDANLYYSRTHPQSHINWKCGIDCDRIDTQIQQKWMKQQLKKVRSSTEHCLYFSYLYLTYVHGVDIFIAVSELCVHIFVWIRFCCFHCSVVHNGGEKKWQSLSIHLDSIVLCCARIFYSFFSMFSAQLAIFTVNKPAMCVNCESVRFIQIYHRLNIYRMSICLMYVYCNALQKRGICARASVFFLSR